MRLPGAFAGLWSDTETAMLDPHVVVLEDDLELRSLVTRGLREEGFAVFAVETGGTAMSGVRARPADAMIVATGPPDADGRDLVQALRAHGETVPVLFLTARDALP